MSDWSAVPTPRLELRVVTAEVIQADLRGKSELARALAVEDPDEWPPPLVAEALPFLAAQLEGSPGDTAWLTRYWVCRTPLPGRLVGLGGFKGPPEAGAVEVGYSVLEGHQGKGYATEAVGALVDWAFSQPGVGLVVAHTLPELRASMLVLERNGFRFVGPGEEAGTIRFERSLSTGTVETPRSEERPPGQRK